MYVSNAWAASCVVEDRHVEAEGMFLSYTT